MKMEKEKKTDEPLKSTVVVKPSLFDELLDEWNEWRGKKRDVKRERDSHIAHPHNTTRKRKKTKRPEDTWWYMGLKLCGLLVEAIAEFIMMVFSFVFSFKLIWILIAIAYFGDFEFKAKIMDAVDKANMEESIEQTESVKKAITDALDATKASLKELKINIEKGDGTSININGSDWFDTDKPEPVPFTQTPLTPKE